MKVDDVLRWLKKLETLSSEGAKVAHVKSLLSLTRQQTILEIENIVVEESKDWVSDGCDETIQSIFNRIKSLKDPLTKGKD